MLTAYVVASIMITVGIIFFSIGWKNARKSKMYDPCAWYFVGVVFAIIGSIIALIQLMMA